MNEIINWSNLNSGFLSLSIFIFTLFLGWVSGIFKKLMYKPEFIIDLMQGPTFCCTFETGKKFEDKDTHRTAIVLYLSIKNIGTAPSEISRIEVGYHNSSFKYSFLWFWLKQTTSLGDFGHTIGEKLRIYPFLFQQSSLLPQDIVTYLKSGQSTKGVVYFEQPESYGSFSPRIIKKKTKIKVKVYDVFNNSYSKVFLAPIVDIEYAKKFNKNFGCTLSEMENNPIEEWNQS